MNIGYARVSTLDQNLELQLQALRKADCKKILREKVSYASHARPEFQRMLEQLRNGGTVTLVVRIPMQFTPTRVGITYCSRSVGRASASAMPFSFYRNSRY